MNIRGLLLASLMSVVFAAKAEVVTEPVQFGFSSASSAENVLQNLENKVEDGSASIEEKNLLDSLDDFARTAEYYREVEALANPVKDNCDALEQVFRNIKENGKSGSFNIEEALEETVSSLKGLSNSILNFLCDFLENKVVNDFLTVEFQNEGLDVPDARYAIDRLINRCLEEGILPFDPRVRPAN